LDSIGGFKSHDLLQFFIPIFGLGKQPEKHGKRSGCQCCWL